jgi:hypothetical protein
LNKIEILFLHICGQQLFNEQEQLQMATTTMMTAIWFHDADEQEEEEEEEYLMMEEITVSKESECDCVECRVNAYQKYWDEERARMQQFKYGVCCDCGVGLDDATSFFYDRREQRCDCYTCDTCFGRFFGQDALFEAANWKSLGKPVPQYVRIDSLV